MRCSPETIAERRVLAKLLLIQALGQHDSEEGVFEIVIPDVGRLERNAVLVGKPRAPLGISHPLASTSVFAWPIRPRNPAWRM
jgi:hypothetical protein